MDLFRTPSRRPREKPKHHSHKSQSKQPKTQPQIPQSLPNRPRNAPYQGNYATNGNEHGQIQQGPRHDYQEPPPPYQFSEHGKSGPRVQYTPSDSKETPAISTAGRSNNNSFHHTNPFDSGNLQFPTAPSHSMSDGFSDSGISEMSEQTGMGPSSQPLAARRHGHRKHTKGRDTRFTSKPVRTDSGYDSDRTMRRVQRTEVPIPKPQESEDESFGGSGNVSVASSDTGLASEVSSDISSVGVTETDDKKREDKVYWKGYRKGFYDCLIEQQQARENAQVYADQLQSGAYSGVRHGRYSTPVYNQLNSWG